MRKAPKWPSTELERLARSPMILQCHKIWTQVCLYSNGQRWFQVWLIGLNVLWHKWNVFKDNYSWPSTYSRSFEQLLPSTMSNISTFQCCKGKRWEWEYFGLLNPPFVKNANDTLSFTIAQPLFTTSLWWLQHSSYTKHSFVWQYEYTHLLANSWR